MLTSTTSWTTSACDDRDDDAADDDVPLAALAGRDRGEDRAHDATMGGGSICDGAVVVVDMVASDDSVIVSHITYDGISVQ